MIYLMIFFCFLFSEDVVVPEHLKQPTKTGDMLVENYDKWDYPSSIILIIADGAGIGQHTMSYYANDGYAPKRFQHVGLVFTHPDDNLKKVTDSAASGTAMATGVKTYNGAISVDHNGKALETVIEIAGELGMATGVIATSTVTHATPASFVAHIDYRKKEAEIARQMAVADVDIIFGGGAEYWTPEIISLVEQNDGQFITELDEPFNPERRIVGLFDDGPLVPHDEGRSPTTTEMTEKALSILSKNAGGFFLMVEESQVDWGGHGNDANYMNGEMQSLNDLVNMCLDYQRNHPNILVVLTSDHECGGVSVHDTQEGNLDVRFTSDYHSADFVPIWATGPGSSFFNAMIDNTMIGKQLIRYVRKQ